MSNEPIRVKIIQDFEPDNPREWEPLTTIVCWHRRTNIGDVNLQSPEEIDNYIYDHRDALNWAKDHGLFRKIFLYEHGDYAFHLDTFGNWPDVRWDAGQVGFIFVNPYHARKVDKRSRITAHCIEHLKTNLLDEYTAWSNYISGDTYSVLRVDDSYLLISGTYEECFHFIEADKSLKLVEEA